jgi:hypothetical protein
MNVRASSRAADESNGALRKLTRLAGSGRLDPVAAIVKSACRIISNLPAFQIPKTPTSITIGKLVSGWLERLARPSVLSARSQRSG